MEIKKSASFILSVRKIIPVFSGDWSETSILKFELFLQTGTMRENDF